MKKLLVLRQLLRNNRGDVIRASSDNLLRCVGCVSKVWNPRQPVILYSAKELAKFDADEVQKGWSSLVSAMVPSLGVNFLELAVRGEFQVRDMHRAYGHLVQLTSQYDITAVILPDLRFNAFVKYVAKDQGITQQLPRNRQFVHGWMFNLEIPELTPILADGLGTPIGA